MGYNGYSLSVKVSIPAYGGEPRYDSDVLDELATDVQGFIRDWAFRHSFSYQGSGWVGYEVNPFSVVVDVL